MKKLLEYLLTIIITIIIIIISYAIGDNLFKPLHNIGILGRVTSIVMGILVISVVSLLILFALMGIYYINLFVKRILK